jgi:uncharacterized protein (DUF302 family)
MKKYIFSLALAIISIAVIAQPLKPYILGSTSKQSMNEIKPLLRSALEQNGFKLVGEYTPVGDADRVVIVVTHPALISSVQEVGGLTGFAGTLRVAATKEGEAVNISYTNPEYWGNAYFRDDFSKVSENFASVSVAFKRAMRSVGTYNGAAFGSEKGEETKTLRKYHYMFGMPYFDETNELGSFESQKAAVARIDANLAKGKPGVKKVYKLVIPDQDLVLYGIALTGETGESKFMPKIDISSPKHTAFLPYEILVMNGEVHMLHGRFRIALSFPDLTMGTFTKIMSTPGEIEDLLSQLAE